MKNKFYIIATPIGNLNEISKRAIDAFNEVSTFFSEDTRVTKKLLKHLEINYSNKTFLIANSYTDNIDPFVIIEALKKGNCALVSDSGYPLISDPGFGLWKVFNQLRIMPEIINGPSAVLHSLVLSGLSTNNFFFQGFLSNNNASRQKQLEAISKIKGTIIVFEGVHKILKTLDKFHEFFGDIEICIVKELTKINETKYQGKISKIINEIDLRGEFVILFENNPQKALNDNLILQEIDRLVKSGTRIKDACKIVAYKYDLKANQLFEKYGSGI